MEQLSPIHAEAAAPFRHLLTATILIAVSPCDVETTSARLTALAGPAERVFASAATEFTWLSDSLPDFASAHQAVQRVRRSLAAHPPVTAALGIYIAQNRIVSLPEQRRKAEAALRRARQKAPGSAEFYSPQLEQRLEEDGHSERRLLNSLTAAVDRNELQIHFQPEISLKTMRPARFEALLRWFPPGDSAIAPSVFIPLAEQSGLILRLGIWVLREACRRAAAWQKTKLAGVGVAVNVSPIQFAARGFVELVESCLAESGLRPDLLELELTETVIIRDFDKSAETLRRLRALGITVAIDDFGTGYSSLGYLQKLPVDAFKLDRCFVSSVRDFNADAPILQGLVRIARDLKIRVVAEGIETPEQYQTIANLGCDEIQGFLFGKPSPDPLNIDGLKTDGPAPEPASSPS